MSLKMILSPTLRGSSKEKSPSWSPAKQELPAVGHVCTDRNVQDGDVHFVVDKVSDGGYQFAGLPADCFARFHDDGQVRIAAVEFVQESYQFFAVVILTGNVVSATEIHPFHLRQILAEMLLESFKYAFQGVCVLFAEGVEVQTFDAIQEFRFEFRFGNSQS